MSVVNSWRAPGAGVVMTDTAHVDIHSGRVASFGSKAFVAADRFPAVVAATFGGGTLDMLIEPFVDARPKNPNVLRRLLPGALRRFQASALAHGSPSAFGRAIAVVWCAKSRAARIFYCSTEGDLCEAFTAAELGYYVSTGIGNPIVNALTAKLEAGLALDPLSDGLELIEAQRAMPFDAVQPELRGRYCIGGAVERAMVTSEGVEFFTDRVWPDRIGSPIVPSITALGVGDAAR